MTSKVIPAQTILTCDRCGAECTRKNHARAGQLTLRQHALDWSGAAVADATRNYDLCDPCLTVVESAVNAALQCERKLPVQPLEAP